MECQNTLLHIQCKVLVKIKPAEHGGRRRQLYSLIYNVDAGREQHPRCSEYYICKSTFVRTEIYLSTLILAAGRITQPQC